jgi:transposase
VINSVWELASLTLSNLTTENEYKQLLRPNRKNNHILLNEQLQAPLSNPNEMSILLLGLLYDYLKKKNSIQPFWTNKNDNVYKELSKRLDKPNIAFQEQEESDEEKEDLLKTLKIQVFPMKDDVLILRNWIYTANYVYNKAVDCINNEKITSFFSLRNELVVSKTKRDDPLYVHNGEENSDIVAVQNPNILDWEKKTPYHIRSYAVKDAITAYKAGMANLRNKNIKFFHLQHRKRKNDGYEVNCITLEARNTKKGVDGNKNYILTFSGVKLFYRYKKEFEIKHDYKLIKEQNKWYILIPVDVIRDVVKPLTSFCGVDAGVRTFMTTFGTNGVNEYEKDNSYLRQEIKKINQQVDKLKKGPKKIRKRSFDKRDRRKENLINELHWKTITSLLDKNDIIYYGDIKSHSIVKDGNNRTLNRDIMDLKLYQFKEKLIYKAHSRAKKVYIVCEAYTTKTCSDCGSQYEIGSSKKYECKKCFLEIDRDVNSAKNILMKGIVTC